MSGTVDGDCTGTVRGLYGDCKFLAFRARALFWSFARNGLGTAPIRTSVRALFTQSFGSDYESFTLTHTGVRTYRHPYI